MEKLVGVRTGRTEPVVFCVGDGHDALLERGRRVRIVAGREEREGVVVIEPDLIVAAPTQRSAPRVVFVYPDEDETDEAAPSPDVVFLTAGDAVDKGNLAAALRLAATPPAEAPPRKRHDDGSPT